MANDGKLFGEAARALRALASEAAESVEYSDWPELQKKVARAQAVAAKLERRAQQGRAAVRN